MKSYPINQIKLISAIAQEIERQHPGVPSDGRFNIIIEAANIIVAEYGREPVLTIPGMGLEAWLNSDDTGASSRYLAWVLSGGNYGTWWGRKQPEPAYPRDGDDFGRCLRLLEAVPDFNGSISKMNDCGPEWAAVVLHWDCWEGLYKGKEDQELYDQIQTAFSKAQGGM